MARIRTIIMRYRDARIDDIPEITRIFNEGVEDKIATYRTTPQTVNDRVAWFLMLPARCKVIIAHDDKRHILGWAALNPVKHSTAPHVFDEVANLSIYIERESRGRGYGKNFLKVVDAVARENGFIRLELDVFDFNEAAIRLYEKAGFKKAGMYSNRAVYEGKPSNVVFMEKML